MTPQELFEKYSVDIQEPKYAAIPRFATGSCCKIEHFFTWKNKDGAPHRFSHIGIKEDAVKLVEHQFLYYGYRQHKESKVLEILRKYKQTRG